MTSYIEAHEFSGALLAWYDRHGRSLPFRGTKDPYRIWLSEIMLQQTRTASVGAYYERFLAAFPDVFSLAAAKEEEVLKMWEGLGYYSRARNLHQAARVIAAEYKGRFPADYDALRALPGVGPYTAAAVASIAFDLPEPAVDGNLTRVLTRALGIREDASLPSVRRRITEEARARMPRTRRGDFNQALMDLGATVCVPGTPDCEKCPLRALCDAYDNGDPENLPVLPRKTPPITLRYAVLLVLWEGRVYMKKRGEGLLNGLYVYMMTEEEPEAALRRLGIEGGGLTPMGEARHVFTHRVWDMDIYLCEARTVPDALRNDFYTRAEMEALPIPTAMRAARRALTEYWEKTS
ncbi:MAG: A/G-specific adenine glycosylase [Clostridia bacterium]|nr:A/G-specific adenine glycosylase [Clostridia bacterium]